MAKSLSAQQSADYLGVDLTTIYNWENRGLLQASHGKRLRFTRKNLRTAQCVAAERQRAARIAGGKLLNTQAVRDRWRAKCFPPPPPGKLSVAEAATLARVHRSTIYQWEKRGWLDRESNGAFTKAAVLRAVAKSKAARRAPKSPIAPGVFSAHGAADHLGVHVTTIYNRYHSGRLKAASTNPLRFTRESLDESETEPAKPRWPQPPEGRFRLSGAADELNRARPTVVRWRKQGLLKASTENPAEFTSQAIKDALERHLPLQPGDVPIRDIRNRVTKKSRKTYSNGLDSLSGKIRNAISRLGIETYTRWGWTRTRKAKKSRPFPLKCVREETVPAIIAAVPELSRDASTIAKDAISSEQLAKKINRQLSLVEKWLAGHDAVIDHDMSSPPKLRTNFASVNRAASASAS